MKQTLEGRPLIFGEVLFDFFPDERAVLGGAPFNVAWHLQAFGASPLLVSRVGNDPLGQQIRDKMHAWDMDTSGLQLDSAHPTGKVDIRFDAGEPHFDIVNEQAYDFIRADALPPLPERALLYHGSLALRNAVSRQSLQTLKESGHRHVFVDVNLREPWWQRDSVLSLMEGARWVKLNENELTQLIPQGMQPGAQAEYLLRHYSLEMLLVTRGSAGAVAYSADGEESSVTPAALATVMDTVGAGDAFTSVVLLGLLRDWPLALALERAQEFASAIVEVRGATVADAGFYRPFITDWKLA